MNDTTVAEAKPTPTTTPTGRPKGGYKNAEGKRVPGVTTITGRFKESGGLIQWAWTMGRDGLDLNAARDAAADAGKICHDMIDAHIHGRPFDATGLPAGPLSKAEHAFLGYLDWAKNTKLTVDAAEIPLVSEKHQFGGTFDAIMLNGERILSDYKTASGIYGEMLIQVAGGYSLLWQEHFPDKPLAGMDILRVSKPDQPDDPVSFHHHHWSAEIFPICQEYFLLLRQAYELDRRVKGLL